MPSNDHEKSAIQLFQEVAASRLSMMDVVSQLRSDGHELLQAIENLVVEPEYEWTGLSDSEFARIAVRAIQNDWHPEAFLQRVETRNP